MTFNKASLTNIITLPYPMFISLPNGYKVKVQEFGDVTLSPKIIIHKVLYVPSFKYNLLFIHSSNVQLNSILLFTKSCCILQTPSMKRHREIGIIKDELYYLCSKCLKNNMVNSKTNPISSCNCICISSFSLHYVVDSCSKNVSLQVTCNESVSFQSVLPCTSNENNVDLLWNNRLDMLLLLKCRVYPLSLHNFPQTALHVHYMSHS